jgi:hypothetical protein
MALENIDFEGSATQQTATNTYGNLANQPDKTDITDGENNDINSSDNNNNQNNQNNGNDNNANDSDNNSDNNNNNDNDSSSTGDLEPGTEIEFDNKVYTVAENGDIVDKDGNVFKEAKDVKAWLDENNAQDDNDNNSSLSINAIREAIGVDVTDENGNAVEFTNDAAGVKSYVDSVIALSSRNIQEGAINKLFADNPLLKQFIDYVQITGSPRGFGDIPDRSGIELDKDNSEQLKAVIRMAAKEFGNKSLNENYLKYLEDSGSLYEEAKNQLEALVGKDKAYRKEIEAQAKAAREQEQQDITAYWQGVSDAIQKRVIGGYKIPESFVKEINGQKITLTPNDFYKYVAEAAVEDEEGNSMTAYQRDLNKLSNEEALNKELLDAWLMFTGGSYKDLVDMAIKEDKVRRLVVKSKEQRSARTIKINKTNNSKVNHDDIILS